MNTENNKEKKNPLFKKKKTVEGEIIEITPERVVLRLAPDVIAYLDEKKYVDILDSAGNYIVHIGDKLIVTIGNRRNKNEYYVSRYGYEIKKGQDFIANQKEGTVLTAQITCIKEKYILVIIENTFRSKISKKNVRGIYTDEKNVYTKLVGDFIDVVVVKDKKGENILLEYSIYQNRLNNQKEYETLKENLFKNSNEGDTFKAIITNLKGNKYLYIKLKDYNDFPIRLKYNAFKSLYKDNVKNVNNFTKQVGDEIEVVVAKKYEHGLGFVESSLYRKKQ